jgi:hypothetical protein
MSWFVQGGGGGFRGALRVRMSLRLCLCWIVRQNSIFYYLQLLVQVEAKSCELLLQGLVLAMDRLL